MTYVEMLSLFENTALCVVLLKKNTQLNNSVPKYTLSDSDTQFITFSL